MVDILFDENKAVLKLKKKISRYRPLVFCKHPPFFFVKKDFALKLGGHRESWVDIFGRRPALEGQNGGTP